MRNIKEYHSAFCKEDLYSALSADEEIICGILNKLNIEIIRSELFYYIHHLMNRYPAKTIPKLCDHSHKDESEHSEECNAHIIYINEIMKELEAFKQYEFVKRLVLEGRCENACIDMLTDLIPGYSIHVLTLILFALPQQVFRINYYNMSQNPDKDFCINILKSRSNAVYQEVTHLREETFGIYGDWCHLSNNDVSTHHKFYCKKAIVH